MKIEKTISQLENHAHYKLNGKDLEALETAIQSLKALETIKKEIEHLQISGDYGKGVMDCYEIVIKAKEEVEND